MALLQFTVSQVRSAAACPRIFYFDAFYTRMGGLKTPSVTRIWKRGKNDEQTAGGSLFHNAIEHFNTNAGADSVILDLLLTSVDGPSLSQALLAHVYRHHVKRDLLFHKEAGQQQAFIAVLKRYVGELADILIHARACGKPPEEILEEMFGDKRRRVNVTFTVGPEHASVRVTGMLDYVFYDWRTAHHRIIDYKLTPADKPGNDLFQVCVYALMHHQQHHTEPDVGVLYLYPSRQMVEKSWEQVFADRPIIHNLLASMGEWMGYDEKTGKGLKPPGEPVYCDVCRWNKHCVTRLGPKHEGRYLTMEQAPIEILPTPVQPIEPFSLQIGKPEEFKELARDPMSKGSLLLGHSVQGNNAVFLPLTALPTHVAVVGAAGSGKTWLAKVLAEEAVAHGVPVLAIDPQGDLVQFLKSSDPQALSTEERLAFDRYWDRVEPRILTPGSSHGSRICLSPIRLPHLGNPSENSDPGRWHEEQESLLTNVAGNLVNLANAGGDSDCQRTYLLQILRHLTLSTQKASITLSDVAGAVFQPESVGLANADALIKKAEREKVSRKLNALLWGPSANLFQGGRPLDLDALLQPTTPGKIPLNVVYLNALPDDDQKQVFVAFLAVEIYRWMVTTGCRKGGLQVLFYVDEARDFIPAGARKPPAKDPLLRLFAQGRKYGVACLLCTQSPRSVDHNVFGNCSTKIIGRLESAQDVDRVAEWFGKESPSPKWLNDRKGALAGTFLARWPEQSKAWEGQAWQSRLLYSMHEGAWSPARVEQENRGQPP